MVRADVAHAILASMADAREPFVHEAELRLDERTDPAAPGAAVTTALCGHWEHDGPCRWPHNNDLQVVDTGATFRTLFVAPASDEDQIRTMIDRALREGVGWSVLHTRARPLSPLEQPLAARLLATPST